METLRKRIVSNWRRVFSLSWPIAVQQTFNTMMRTVDIVVTGLFSPAAVAAVGLADLYAQIPLRIGEGLGAGAIALSSQETGRDSTETRNRAITQAFIIGFLAGLPLVIIGVTLTEYLIAILGAESAVVRMAGTYLAMIFVAAPMRIVGLVGSRSLHGTGDTQTPMIINSSASILNIFTTIGLGLVIGPFPELGILGVGLATATSRTFSALAVSGVIASDRTKLSFTRPREVTITRQLLAVSVPNFAAGMSTSIANFPFNSLLLTFGTEVNAAYHISRRIYQQFAGPIYRSFNVVASIIVGQALGAGDPDRARFSGIAITVLSVLVLGVVGIVLFVWAGPIARVFTGDPETLGHAVLFTRLFGLSMPFFGVFFPVAGSLRAAGDTRTPFYARFIGTLGFMLGFSYVVGIRLGYGLTGLFAGIGLSYVCWASIVVAGFVWGNWADKAERMIDVRGDISD